MNNLEFALEMKNKRLASGLSQGELASLTHVSRYSISLFFPFLTSTISINIHIYGFNQIGFTFLAFLYFILLCLFIYKNIVILICLFVNIFFCLYKLY